MFKVGLGYGVVGHYWYKFLDWKFVGYTKRALLSKLACEVIAGPIFGLATFLAVGYCEGRARKDTVLDFISNIENLILVKSFIRFCIVTFNLLSSLFRPIVQSISLYNIIILMLFHLNIDFFLWL